MSKPLPPLVTLEDHYLSHAASANAMERYNIMSRHNPKLVDNLKDVGATRLAAMDSGEASLQIVSSTPGLATTSPEDCRKTNDQLYESIQTEEKRAGGGDGKRRFAGFAVLPMLDPAASITELRRCIKDLGFVGALVDNHAEGTFYDGEAYDALWEEVVALDIPFYLHPNWPEEAMIATRYKSDRFNDAAKLTMGGPGWGWHSDTAIHILRLFAAGLFDRCPKLKIIIGHMGEMMPYQLARIQRISRSWGERQRSFEQVWNENVWITTSGNWSLDPLACLLRNTRVDRIMWSVDYPFAEFGPARDWLVELRASGLVSEEAFAGICHRNAERLLRVTAPAR
ncbi:MAG: hypothetical protein Q9159_003837 [Coniocarpon cinnabarinum]